MVRGPLFSIAIVFSLVIIRDLHIVGIAVLEAKADPPLIVDGNDRRFTCHVTLVKCLIVFPYHSPINLAKRAIHHKPPNPFA
jgi:hypothetical protein